MTTTAIIPAYNEEKTVGRVVQTVKNVPLIDEVVVVSDGSQDRTAEVAERAGARVINLPKNLGKGGAMKAGLDATRGDIVVFLDADLLGLREKHVRQLVEPILRGEADTTLGVFANGRLSTDLAQKVCPFLSGQRAFRRDVLQSMPDFAETGYGVEIALTRSIQKGNIRLKEVEFDDVTQIMKEEKMGFFKGLAARMRMYWEIVKYLR